MAELVIEKTYPIYTSYLFHFIILGIGGTGSELVPKLCRQINNLRDLGGKQKHFITLCDGDEVEPKNINRQNFTMADIGKNKAEVMGLKCGTVFNLQVDTFNSYIENHDKLGRIIDMHPRHIPFIVGCVDNTAVRKMIHEYVAEWKKHDPIFYLDSGNEEFAGQVVMGIKVSGGTKVKPAVRQLNGIKDGETWEQMLYLYNLPDVCLHYPEMLETKEKFTTELSCAERAVSNPQAADANVEAATILYQFISNCFRGVLEYNKVTFNTLKGNRRTFFNVPSIITAAPCKARISDLEIAELAKEVVLWDCTREKESTEGAPPPILNDVADPTVHALRRFIINDQIDGPAPMTTINITNQVGVMEPVDQVEDGVPDAPAETTQGVGRAGLRRAPTGYAVINGAGEIVTGHHGAANPTTH